MDTEALQRSMARKGCTRRELARALKLSPRGLERRLKGEKSWTVAQVLALCRLLDIRQNREKRQIFLDESSHLWDEQSKERGRNP